MTSSPTTTATPSMVLQTRPRSHSYVQSWEPEIADRVREAVEHRPDSQLPYLVALVGVPGAGKTISAFLVATLLEEHGIDTMIMPHDGYHYFLETLKSFPDEEEAVYRRGAPDTFDPSALLRDLDRIRNNQEETIIQVPGFDHAKADPEPAKHTFDRQRHKVVICEGLYLLHDEDGWEDVASAFDLKVFINSDVDECIERVKIRNQCIPGYTPEEIAIRCERVDRVNAGTVMKCKGRADVIVNSVMSSSHKRKPSEPPTDMMNALTLLQQTDVDNVQTNENSDWTMDITSRPSTQSFTALTRNDSIMSTKSEPPPPPASAFVGTWEPAMAERIRQEVDTADRLPYMVALVGGPGSGKSISTFLLANILEESGYETMVCPHDGYHWPLDYLRTFPDAEDVIYRRGAPDTFDPQALLRDLIRIRDNEEEILIKLPAFDHARADPEPDTHIFDRHKHKIVICEGLYLLHDQDGWEDIASVFDFKIFLNSDVETCIERVKIRNQCIPGYTPEEIEVRTEKVDRINALTVARSKARADMIVEAKALPK